MRYLFVLPLELLAGCQTAAPAISIRTVEIPVPQPCMDAEDIPSEPASVGHLITGAAENAAAERDVLAALVLRLRAWGRPMEAAHRACAG